MIYVHVWLQTIKRFDEKTKEVKESDKQREDRRAANPILKEYEAKYEEEVSLNYNFNVFVKNFQLAYGGCNTAQSQIGAKYTEEERELRWFHRTCTCIFRYQLSFSILFCGRRWPATWTIIPGWQPLLYRVEMSGLWNNVLLKMYHKLKRMQENPECDSR